MELSPSFNNDISDIVLATRTELDPENACTQFEMGFDKGSMSIKLRHLGTINLSQIRFVFVKDSKSLSLDSFWIKKLIKLANVLDKLRLEDVLEIDYLLLSIKEGTSVDWVPICSINLLNCRCENHICNITTKSGEVCTCILKNSVVHTPHNGQLYITTGIMDLDGNSHLDMMDGGVIAYKKYYEQKHSIQLQFEKQKLLQARHIFHVKNYCHGRRKENDTEAGKSSVELPPELCHIVMEPLPLRTIFPFSFIPPIMHRIESLLVASNLKKMHSDHCRQNEIQTIKVLEAITTKRCKESFHYEALETLGDSFLKYAASQQLFTTYQNQHEGLLSLKREKIISNAALCKFGCGSRLLGFIRNEPFDPKAWAVPGDKSGSLKIKELDSTGTNIFVNGNGN